MTILDKIKAHKLIEIRDLRKKTTPTQLREMPLFSKSCTSLKTALTADSSSGIIAEFKRSSPSKGAINLEAAVELVCGGYEKAGAAALSILTDSYFFGARETDFSLGRAQVKIPVLRKDFIVDSFQILESKAMGADAILLIAKILEVSEIIEFTALAHEIGLEVFLEVENELEILQTRAVPVDVVGINNRDLSAFSICSEKSIALISLLDPKAVRVSESGITDPARVLELRKLGFSGFLIGSHFMNAVDPAQSCTEFINRLNKQL